MPGRLRRLVPPAASALPPLTQPIATQPLLNCRMKLVGLTGGIACGKSTVTKLLRSAGIAVIDADEIAHSVTARGAWGYRRVVAAFGPSILSSDGQLDREALASLVFRDAALRRRLNSATHPAVGLELARQILVAWLCCRPVVVVDMPLLFESGFARLTHPTVLVACSPAVQLQRIMRRDGLAPPAAEARIAAQMPLEAKRKLASICLDNDGDHEALAAQVQQLVQRLWRRAWLHRVVLSPLGLVAAAAAIALLW